MVEAAENLYLTPQTLSMAIKKLETELDMQLIYRFPTGITLSENGTWLVELSKEFFEKIKHRQEEYKLYLMTNAMPPTGHIELAVNMMGITNSKLTKMIQNIYVNYPDTDITFNEQCRDIIEERIISKDLEMGFIYRTKYNEIYLDNLSDSLVFYPLQTGKLVLQVSPELEQLSKQNSISIKQMSQYKVCSYTTDACNGQTKYFLNMIKNQKIDFYETNCFAQYQANILSGKYIGISLLLDGEKSCANNIEGTKAIPIQDDINTYFGILRRKDAELTNNTSFVFNETLKCYNLNTTSLMENVKEYLK